MFKLFIENKLLSPNQPFDEGFEVRGAFLDMSRVFHKVWHEGPIFKLKQNGISGNSLNLRDFLRNRKRRASLNGQVSDRSNVKADVPQSNTFIHYCF